MLLDCQQLRKTNPAFQKLLRNSAQLFSPSKMICKNLTQKGSPVSVNPSHCNFAALFQNLAFLVVLYHLFLPYDFFLACFNNLFSDYHCLFRLSNFSCPLVHTPYYSLRATVAFTAFCLAKLGELFQSALIKQTCHSPIVLEAVLNFFRFEFIYSRLTKTVQGILEKTCIQYSRMNNLLYPSQKS